MHSTVLSYFTQIILIKKYTFIKILTLIYFNCRKPVFGGADWIPVSPGAGVSGPINHLHISSPDDAKTEASGDLGNRAFWDSLPLNEPPMYSASGRHTEF